MKTYKHVAQVVFNGEFPIDMLRYDRCSPLNQSDVSIVHKSIQDGFSKTQLTVEICKICNDKKPNWTSERWSSFGCKLTEVNCYTL